MLLVAGCGGGERPATLSSAPPAPAAAPQDALGRFVASAAPGRDGLVTFEDGRSAPVRVLRAYAAASGRECREVLVGSGTGGRANLLCQTDGQWVPARPLLLGNVGARP
ncbi:DVU3141 family protein [Paracraurococcus lichenis]|uniref:DVU3141 family protein n=1 Tax=Paracraurococcus lichenis TaxID=3064888 RepID=A0ABT9DU29_9PROT|nr:DVU3141 family protein [Paracraurococcus sp. LOR1-02]MDO9707388.1 DVU3141 family protein [Paracraurococcus sp. LOR1-02]